MKIGRKVVGGVLTIILVTVLIAWNLSQPTPRLTRVQSSLLSDDLYVMDIEYGGFQTLSISNGSHLLLFDVYQENVTEVVRIPGEIIISTFSFSLVYFPSIGSSKNRARTEINNITAKILVKI